MKKTKKKFLKLKKINIGICRNEFNPFKADACISEVMRVFNTANALLMCKRICVCVYVYVCVCVKVLFFVSGYNYCFTLDKLNCIYVYELCIFFILRLRKE